MVTSAELIKYICDRVCAYGAVRSRKMFGDYMIYIDGRPVLLVCDGTVFVKQLPELSGLMDGAMRGIPYDGAKEHYAVDPDDTELLDRLIPQLLDLTPMTVRRTKKAVEK